MAECLLIHDLDYLGDWTFDISLVYLLHACFSSSFIIGRVYRGGGGGVCSFPLHFYFYLKVSYKIIFLSLI